VGGAILLALARTGQNFKTNPLLPMAYVTPSVGKKVPGPTPIPETDKLHLKMDGWNTFLLDGP